MLSLVHFSVKGLQKEKIKIVNSFPNPELLLSPKFMLPFSIHLFPKFIYEVYTPHEGRDFVHLFHQSIPKSTVPVKEYKLHKYLNSPGLTVWLSWLEHHLVYWKVAAGSIPGLGAYGRQLIDVSLTSVFLCLSSPLPSLPSFLSKVNKKHILWWGKINDYLNKSMND